MRNTPPDADPWDEANWYPANPALGDFLSIQALRDEAIEAKNDPTKENSFRQFRLNQWVSQTSRWMPMHLWHANIGELWTSADWGAKKIGRKAACFGGLDLASKWDLTSWCMLFPGANPEDPLHAVWRFWLPESGLEQLNKLHQGKWTTYAREGWVTVTEGNVSDFDRIVADIGKDAKRYSIGSIDADEWSMWPLIKQVADVTGLSVERGEVTAYRNTYDRMSSGMDDVMAMCKNEQLMHHNNKVATFCFEHVEVQRASYDQNLIRPVKPNRDSDRARIDGVIALALAANGLRAAQAKRKRISPYEDRGPMVI
jgi:phage terminase large subunit-like protein